MTVEARIPQAQFVGDGTTTLFPTGSGLNAFTFDAFSDLEVSTRASAGTSWTVLTLGAQYTVTGGDGASGNVVFSVAPASGDIVRIRRRTARTQPTDYRTNDDFPAESHEGALDRTVRMVQEIDDDLADIQNRALRSVIGQTFAAIDKTLFASKFFAFDATGTPVPSVGLGSDSDLRTDMGGDDGAALSGFKPPWANSVKTSLKETASRVVHVKDFMTVLDRAAVIIGLKPDVAYAYNRATRSTEVWSEALEYTIMGPPFRHKVRSTVYTRKGQTIDFQDGFIDCSDNDDVVRFLAGWGLIAGVPTLDAGGSPVRFRNGRTLGGSGSKGFFKFQQIAGGEISSMFMTSPGLAIEVIDSADLTISDIEVDQALSGLSLTGCQNIAVTNFSTYVVNFSITIGSNCRDITIVGGNIKYPGFAGLYLADSASEIRNIRATGINFVMNAQTVTFAGYIYSRATNAELDVTGCGFRNWREFAINHEAGGTLRLGFFSCTFDGKRSTTAYTQSTTAKGFQSATDCTMIFEGCVWANLLGEIGKITQGSARITMKGGRVIDCPETRLNITATGRPKISISTPGFAFVKNTATHQAIVLPYWGLSTGWRVSARANDGAGTGNGNYNSFEEGIVTVSVAFDGSNIQRFCDYSQKHKTPTRAIPGDLGLVACFGTAAGGAASSTSLTEVHGTLCVAAPVPTADANDFDWEVETIA